METSHWLEYDDDDVRAMRARWHQGWGSGHVEGRPCLHETLGWGAYWWEPEHAHKADGDVKNADGREIICTTCGAVFDDEDELMRQRDRQYERLGYMQWATAEWEVIVASLHKVLHVFEDYVRSQPEIARREALARCLAIVVLAARHDLTCEPTFSTLTSLGYNWVPKDPGPWRYGLYRHHHDEEEQQPDHRQERVVESKQYKSRKTSNSCYVYAIGSPEGGHVKIGVTYNLETRLTEIQRHSPLLLQVLWQTEGSYALEQRLHIAFNAQRTWGEWFDLGPDPVTAITTMIASFED